MDDRIQSPAPPSEPPSKTPSPPVEKDLPRSHDSIKGDVASLFAGPLSLFDSLHFEELFLIGLIILLARSDQGSDVVLWLALLLFCK
jgi:hypothetical protein